MYMHIPVDLHEYSTRILDIDSSNCRTLGRMMFQSLQTLKIISGVNFLMNFKEL